MVMKQPEMYRSMLMNVLLFEPIGLTLPFALSYKFQKKAMITIGFGFLLSAVIEIIQYVFFLGRTEVDDVICNTLGCAIGTGAYLIYKNREIINKCLRELGLTMKETLKTKKNIFKKYRHIDKLNVEIAVFKSISSPITVITSLIIKLLI